MSQPPIGVVILISGRGSNMQSIIEAARDGGMPVEIRTVISNNPDAPGLEYARKAGIDSRILDHRDFASRETFDRTLMALIDEYRPDLVALAGFMRILSMAFVDHYAGRLMNIHPALLPAFPGLNTHARALEAGVRRHGASVHFVTHDVDAGPNIIQAVVEILPDDTPETLATRVLKEEHRIYPLAIGWFAEGRLTIKDGKVLLDGTQKLEQGLVEPDPKTTTATAPGGA